MRRLVSILGLICGAAFAQIQDIPGTEAVGVSRQRIVDNFNFLNTGKAVASIGTALPGTCAYSAAGPVVFFVNSTVPTLSVCSAPNVWTQVLGEASVTWGQILGTLTSQADLTAALAGKAALNHASRHQNGGADEIAAVTAAANAIPKAGASGTLDIGWVPTGQTGTTVALGNDARFNNARTPTVHAVSHQNGGSDEVATGTAAPNAIPKAGAGGKLDIGWLPTGSTGTTVALGNDARLSDSRTPTAHKTSHQHGGTDEIATGTPAANAIPKADGTGKLASGWIPAGIGGIVTQTTSTADPSGACTAPSTTALTTHFRSDTGDLWFCQSSGTWQKILIADASGGYVETGTTGTAPANPSAGSVKCYFDSTAKTQICLDESGNAFIGVKGQASRDANKFVTHITPLGIPQTAQPDWADLANKPSTFAPPNPAASTKGGVYSISCSAGQHVSAISSTDGSVTCSADTTGDPATKFKTVRVLGYEVMGSGTAGVLQAADFTGSFAAAINNADAKTLTEASCISDTGDQTIVVSVGGSARFTIHCVVAGSYSRSTTDGSTGYIIAASMTNTAVAAGAVLDVTGTANGSTKDLKVFAYGTVN